VFTRIRTEISTQVYLENLTWALPLS